MKTYAYRYVDDQERPLLVCPYCGGDLTEEGGIDLELVIADRCIEVESCLTEQGELMDTDDKAVANGYHGCTNCGHCGVQLVYHEVEEETDVSN
jgi:hypothetical protein